VFLRHRIEFTCTTLLRTVVSSKILRVESLTKRFGEFLALDACSVDIDQGCVFGLLGPNGAGKTTLIRCLLGYLKPTSGSAWIQDLDCIHESVQVRRVVSYLPAESKLFRMMRGKDCLEFFTTIHPRGDKPLALSLAQRLDLDLNRRVAFMSTGMRQKLAICCVMSCPSPLIVLDEPTANLDPTVRAMVLDLVKEAKARGATIAFCSHVLSEIEEICDAVAILRRGRVVHTGLIAQIRQIHRISATVPESFDPSTLPDETQLVARDHNRITADFPGTLDRYWKWLDRNGWTELQAELVGLRSLYEEHHSNPELAASHKSPSTN
jgi:ABC-2 type transport system ATP-binding protein